MKERELYFKKTKINNLPLWKEKGLLLGHLGIELTERCNNNCIHCCINLADDNSPAKKREISVDKIIGILKEAVSLGCLSVRFTGGEPLLRDDFAELYVFARKSGLKVKIFTNATRITSSLVQLFERVPPLEKIEVSVYGMRKSSYEAVTGVAGSYAAAWRGINLLLEHKVPFVIKAVLLPGNKTEIDELESWVAAIPWMEGKPPSYSLFLDLRCRRDDFKKNELIKKLRLTPEEWLKVLMRRPQSYLKEMRQFCDKFIISSEAKLFTCGAGVGSGCVDAYGNFQMCMMLKDPETVYNLQDGSLKDALTNFFPKFREIKSTNPDYLSRCAKCFLKGLCQQCPAKSWMEYGTLDTPVEYFCDIAHAQARCLGLLKENEKAWEVEGWRKRIMEFVGN